RLESEERSAVADLDCRADGDAICDHESVDHRHHHARPKGGGGELAVVKGFLTENVGEDVGRGHGRCQRESERGKRVHARKSAPVSCESRMDWRSTPRALRPPPPSIRLCSRRPALEICRLPACGWCP